MSSFTLTLKSREKNVQRQKCKEIFSGIIDFPIKKLFKGNEIIRISFILLKRRENCKGGFVNANCRREICHDRPKMKVVNSIKNLILWQVKKSYYG